VILRFTDSNTVAVSQILVKQLLEEVTADEAIALIEELSKSAT
jgi:hypothetical protein